MSKSKTDQLLDQILMLNMGNNGNKQAHLFLERLARFPMENAGEAAWHKPPDARLFVPPKEEDRVILFADGSGVYVHADGLCTIMGADISNEVDAWQEVE